MNIFEGIDFHKDSPTVVKLKKTEKINAFAVALGENATLKKHKTPVPALLTVIKGEINFVLADREYVFKQGDVFEIPVEVEHFVVGVLKENVFTVVQEL